MPRTLQGASGFKHQTFNPQINGARLALEPPLTDEKWRPREVRTPAEVMELMRGEAGLD